MRLLSRRRRRVRRRQLCGGVRHGEAFLRENRVGHARARRSAARCSAARCGSSPGAPGRGPSRIKRGHLRVAVLLDDVDALVGVDESAELRREG